MKCAVTGCDKDAVTFHGVTCTTHGYCEEHRCCYVCGRHITECRCATPMERPEYIQYKARQLLEKIKEPKANFLQPHEEDSVAEAGFHFVNCETEDERSVWWGILCDLIRKEW